MRVKNIHEARLFILMTQSIFGPHTPDEYEPRVELCDRLIDQVGEDETHPLASLMEVLRVLIEGYETENVPELKAL